MSSALASPPPPFSIGPGADLKANARRFLERALVISALAHLVAVGVFRASLERFATTEQEVQIIPGPWTPPAKFMPPLAPFTKVSNPAAGAPTDKGVIDPVDPKEILSNVDHGPQGPAIDPIAAEPRGGPDVPSPGPPNPPLQEPGFSYADTPPVPILAPHPAYPSWAREAGIEGKVLVKVLVGMDGVPIQVVIVRGPKGLTEGVESALLRWRFRPGLVNGRPVRVWVEIPILFKLGD